MLLCLMLQRSSLTAVRPSSTGVLQAQSPVDPRREARRCARRSGQVADRGRPPISATEVQFNRCLAVSPRVTGRAHQGQLMSSSLSIDRLAAAFWHCQPNPDWHLKHFTRNTNMKLFTRHLARLLVLMGLMVLSASSFAGPCPDGSLFNSKTGACEQIAGWYGHAATGLYPCPAGTYNPKTRQADVSACLAASKGNFASGTGNSQQTACPQGSTTTISGATKSTQCLNKAGYYGSVGSTTFPACPTGKSSVEGRSVCDSPSGSCSASFCQ
jgi:hypothetical protein